MTLTRRFRFLRAGVRRVLTPGEFRDPVLTDAYGATHRWSLVSMIGETHGVWRNVDYGLTEADARRRAGQFTFGGHPLTAMPTQDVDAHNRQVGQDLGLTPEEWSQWCADYAAEEWKRSTTYEPSGVIAYEPRRQWGFVMAGDADAPR